MDLALCIWLAGEIQKWLSVSGAVVREKAMTAEAGFINLFECQESSIQGP
jgi:hypothetical protein